MRFQTFSRSTIGLSTSFLVKDTYSLPLVWEEVGGGGGVGWGGAVHYDCTQYIALIVVAYIKGWSYLSDFEVIITVWCLFVWDQKGGNEYDLIKCSLFYLFMYYH